MHNSVTKIVYICRRILPKLITFIGMQTKILQQGVRKKCNKNDKFIDILEVEKIPHIGLMWEDISYRNDQVKTDCPDMGYNFGEAGQWVKPTDCKSVAYSYGSPNLSLPTNFGYFVVFRYIY